MGRGKSFANQALIQAARTILEAIQPASVRAVCYQLFTRKLIPSMSKTHTNRVSVQLRDARMLRVIPWHWIVDETRSAERINAWTDRADYVATVKRSYRRDRWADQDDHIEVWSEKGTIRGTLRPVLDTYGVTFRVMHGYGSTTTLHEVAEQSACDVQPWTVYYVGDRDPSGLHMSEVDLPRRMEALGGAVAIHRVALTDKHTTARPPLPSFSVEEKRNDSRYGWYKTRFPGGLCFELDALSPVALRQEVESAIRSHIDWDAWERAEIVERAELESFDILDQWPGISGPASK